MGKEEDSNKKYITITILLSDIRDFSPEGLNSPR